VITRKEEAEIDRKIAKSRADARRWPNSPAPATAEYWEGKRHDAIAERLIERMESGVIAFLDCMNP